MITASTTLQTSAVSSGNKLASRNSPLSFSMSLSPGAGSSASPTSSVSRADSVATGASPVGRSATPSPDRRSPGAGGSHNLHESPVSFSGGNRRPHSSASSPIRRSATPTREGRGDRDHPAGLSGVAAGMGSALHVPMTSSMSFAALHAAAAAAAANQGALLHGKAGLLAGMGPGMSGVPVSLAGLAGIPEHAYHPGLYLGHPAAAAAAAAAAANLQGAERSLFGQGLHGHPGLHGGSGHGNHHSSNHHNDRSPYNSHSPPPIPTTDPTANECKLVDYRGQKVAAFIIHGETMLCLPQAFELFLKHLVGGLHTVYTKLKRLDIVPLVCNVEQVRILRGLGAIQPGVNRCKLLSCKDFDILYKDCTTARPGRPPKRSPLMGITSPQHDVLMKMKKPRLDNGDYLPYENGHGGTDSRMEKSPLLANGYNQPPTHLNPMQFMALNHAAQQAAAAAAAQHALLGSPASAGALSQGGGLSSGLAGLGGAGNHPALSGQNQGSGLPNYGNHNGGGAGHHGLALSRAESDSIKGHGSVAVDPITAARSGFWENCRAAYEDVVKHLERLKDDRSESEKTTSTLDAKTRDLTVHNGSSASPILNLSKSGDANAAADAAHADAAHREALSAAGTASAAQDEHDDDDEDGDAETEERAHRNESGASASDDRHGHFHQRLQQQHHHSQAATSAAAEEDHSDVNEDEDDEDEDKHEMSDGMGRDESSSPRPHGDKGLQAARASTATSAQAVAAAAALNYSAFLNASVASHGDPSVMLNSTENLLRNIQGLLKVAAENARQQDRQANYEKAELKMEILREREMREGLEKQMLEEQRARVLYQKRLKKERRARRKLTDQLDLEVKRRGQYEEALKSTSAETLRMINEKLNQEIEMERSARNSSSQSQSSQPTPAANEMMNTSLSDNRGVYYKNSVLFTNAS